MIYVVAGERLYTFQGGYRLEIKGELVTIVNELGLSGASFPLRNVSYYGHVQSEEMKAAVEYQEATKKLFEQLQKEKEAQDKRPGEAPHTPVRCAVCEQTKLRADMAKHSDGRLICFGCIGTVDQCAECDTPKDLNSNPPTPLYRGSDKLYRCGVCVVKLEEESQRQREIVECFICHQKVEERLTAFYPDKGKACPPCHEKSKPARKAGADRGFHSVSKEVRNNAADSTSVIRKKCDKCGTSTKRDQLAMRTLDTVSVYLCPPCDSPLSRDHS